MRTTVLAAAAAALLGLTELSFAQTPGSAGGTGASGSGVGTSGSVVGRNQESAADRCATMTGVQKEQCLRDERRRVDADRAAQGPELRGSCDALFGPEKERCLRQGGTVEAGAKPSSGASGAATGK